MSDLGGMKEVWWDISGRIETEYKRDVNKSGINILMECDYYQ